MIFLSDWYKFIKEIFYLSSYFLSSKITKNPNLWVFGSWYGCTYSDNSKYLFEYVNKNKKNIKAVWLTRNKEVVEKIRKKGMRAYLFGDIRAYYFCIRAGVAIFCVGRMYDLPTPYLSKKTKLIQLWHGDGLKKNIKKKESYPKLRNYSYYINHKNKFFYHLIINVHNLFTKSKIKKIEQIPYKSESMQNYDLFITKSNLGKKRIIDFNIIKHNKIIISGYPRNDILFQKRNVIDKLSSLIKNYKRNEYKIIIFMPTFRTYNNKSVINHLLKSLKIEEKSLIKNKILVFFKIHNKLTYVIFKNNIKTKIKNFIILNVDDIYPYLNMTDCLITDYSSVYTDYLLLNKPIIYFNWDQKNYEKNGGFYFDYDKYTPGPKTKKWKEVLNLLTTKWSSLDSYKNQRNKMNKLFNRFHDGKNCERVYDEIIKTFEIK